jgi:hypothetical protein
MPFSNIETLKVIETMENFLQKIRPDESIRPQLDYTYKIENLSVVIYEVRPDWLNKKVITEMGIAKTTFVKSRNSWKIYWKRANDNWDPYEPKPVVKQLNDFLKVVVEDKYGCFFG